MAREILTPVRANMSGAVVALTAPTVDGDAVLPGSGLLVNNTDGATALTVTIVTGGTVNGLAIDDLTVSVPALTQVFLGPFKEDYLPATTGATKGRVHVDYSRVTGVVRAALDVA